MSCGIYYIRNTKSKKFYIGSANDVQHRWYTHKWKLNTNAHDNPHLQAAWNKYGKDAFSVECIEQCSRTKLLLIEQQHLDKWWVSGLLYNINPTADAPPNMMGIPHAIEHKKHIGDAHRGRPKTETHKKNLSKAIQAWFQSPKNKQKFRRALVLHYKTHPDQLKRLQTQRLGCVCSSEVRENYKRTRVRGSSHVNSKLTEKQVVSIREEYVPFKFGLQRLAKKYGVDRKTILSILQRKSWTHV
jgi:group I intron endonuclease